MGMGRDCQNSGHVSQRDLTCDMSRRKNYIKSVMKNFKIIHFQASDQNQT